MANTIRSFWGSCWLNGEEQLITQWVVNETVRRSIQISVGFQALRINQPTVTDEVVIELDREQAIKMGRALLAYGFGGKECEETRGCDGHPLWECDETCDGKPSDNSD